MLIDVRRTTAIGARAQLPAESPDSVSARACWRSFCDVGPYVYRSWRQRVVELACGREQRMRRGLLISAFLALGLLTVSNLVSAQQTGQSAVAGVVKDSTG